MTETIKRSSPSRNTVPIAHSMAYCARRSREATEVCQRGHAPATPRSDPRRQSRSASAWPSRSRAACASALRGNGEALAQPTHGSPWVRTMLQRLRSKTGLPMSSGMGRVPGSFSLPLLVLRLVVVGEGKGPWAMARRIRFGRSPWASVGDCRSRTSSTVFSPALACAARSQGRSL
jgi:hypothetical protein